MLHDLLRDTSVSAEQLLQFFPHLTPESAMLLHQDADAFVAELARSHDLTVAEATEVLEDALFFAAAAEDRVKAA